MTILKKIMKNKSRLVKLSCELGGYHIARWLTRNQPKILMMHRFSEEKKPGYIDRNTLRRQISILQRQFNVIPLQDLTEALEKKTKLPKNSIVLTIDDGYQDMYQIAFPEFKAANMPVTLFVTTGFVDHQCWLWPDRVSTLLHEVNNDLTVDFSGREVTLPSKLFSSWQQINDYLLPLNLVEKNAWIDKHAKKNNVQLPNAIPEKYVPATWEQLKEMSQSVVEIGAHTVSHPILSAETAEDVKMQVTECKSRLEQQLDILINSFCYPNGQPVDFTKNDEELVKQAKYNVAVSANCYSIAVDNIFALPRFVMSEDMYHFTKVINGVQWITRKLFPGSNV